MKKFLKVISLLLLPSLIAGQQESSYLSSLYSSLSDATSDTARMKVCSKLGSYYYLSLEDRDSSNFYLEKALSIAVRLNLKFDEASILNKMGVIQMQQEKFSKSLEFYLKALNIAKDPTIEKTIWHLSPGQNPRNARMLLLSDSYDLIGLLNAYTGNWIVNTKNQLKNYREAEKYAKAAGDTGRIAYINFHMGVAYMNEGKLDSALTLIKKAISTFSDLKDQSGLGRAMKFLGDTYEKMGNFDLAANTILQAITLLKETSDHLHLGLGYISLSRVYTDLKKNDSALYYAKESLKIFEKRKDPAWKRDAYNLITSCFDQLGRTDSAIVYLKLAKSLSDSLSVEDRKNLLEFQDVVVGEQAKLEKLEKEKIETREKSRIYLLLSGIVVFIVIAFLLYRNNQHRKKTNETLRQRNEKIENTLHQLRSTQTQLIQSEKMASLGELTAGIAHEIQNPLNFVNNFSDVNKEMLEEMKEELAMGNKQWATGNSQEAKFKIEQAIAIANNVIDNEAKINHHGKRAESIVKGMLQHSRKSTGIKEPTDINALADEYMRLSYHGLRAKDKSFNSEFRMDLDPTLPLIHVIPQDIGRVLLNLFNNAFWAVNEKFKNNLFNKGDVNKIQNGEDQELGSPSGVRGNTINKLSYPPPAPKREQDFVYQPLVSLTTKNFIDHIEIHIADNGPGVPPNIIDKIFQPFFTTKPTGQGTGLGLSLAYDIIKAHGGELKVETKQGDARLPDGQGTTFSIILPNHI